MIQKEQLTQQKTMETERGPGSSGEPEEKDPPDNKEGGEPDERVEAKEESEAGRYEVYEWTLRDGRGELLFSSGDPMEAHRFLAEREAGEEKRELRIRDIEINMDYYGRRGALSLDAFKRIAEKSGKTDKDDEGLPAH